MKQAERLFNPVSPDQSQEWLNRIRKKGDGITVSRRALSDTLRSHLGSDTKLGYGMGQDDSLTHNENNLVRQKVDLKDEDNNLNKFLHVSDVSGLKLHNNVNKD